MKTRLMMVVSMLGVAAGATMARAGGTEKQWVHTIEVDVAAAANVAGIKAVGTLSDPDAVASLAVDRVIKADATVLHTDGKVCHAKNEPTYDVTVSFTDKFGRVAMYKFESKNAAGGMTNGGGKVMPGTTGERVDKIMGTPNTAQVVVRTTACKKIGEKWVAMALVDPHATMVAVKVGPAGTLVQIPACTLPPGQPGTACRDVVELGYDLQVLDTSKLGDAFAKKLQGVAEAVKAGNFGDARRLAREARLELPKPSF
jgi:hypothetical protein